VLGQAGLIQASIIGRHLSCGERSDIACIRSLLRRRLLRRRHARTRRRRSVWLVDFHRFATAVLSLRAVLLRHVYPCLQRRVFYHSFAATQPWLGLAQFGLLGHLGKLNPVRRLGDGRPFACLLLSAWHLVSPFSLRVSYLWRPSSCARLESVFRNVATAKKKAFFPALTKVPIDQVRGN